MTLEPCPFCAATLEDRGGFASAHPKNDCILSGHGIIGDADEAAWNRRASDWQPTATAPRTPGALIVVRTTETRTCRWMEEDGRGWWETMVDWGWVMDAELPEGEWRASL